MPSFKTPPEPDSSARSPYDDLNRLERNLDRNNDRNPERRDDRNPDRSLSRQLDRPDDRNEADIRAQERLERVVERNGRELDRDKDREPVPTASVAPRKPPADPRKSADGTDPLIQGLFSKLPEPEAEWPLAARQKWLQTAANIFDLMYAPNQADAGELAIRVERTAAR